MKNISKYEMQKMGIEDDLKIVETLEDLRNSSSSMVVTECTKTIKFRQNNFKKEESFIKKNKYVMALGAYLKIISSSSISFLKPSDIKFNKIYKPFSGQDLSNKTLFLWRQGGIGDLLFITPNLLYLKEKYPTCKIILACGPQYHSMVEKWNFVDNVYSAPFNVSLMYKSDYHVTFDGVIERTKQAEKESSYVLFSKWMNLNLPKEKLRPYQNIDDEYVEKVKNKINEKFNIKEKDFILMQLRASSILRTPRPEFWKKIIDILSENHKIIITDSPSNIKPIDNFIRKLKYPENVFNYSSLSEEIYDTISLCKLAKMVIGPDSSLIHIAESLDIKNFGIYGAFRGDTRLSTYKYSDWIDSKSKCAPCFTHGNKLCQNTFRTFPRCYDSIDTNEVIEKINNLLERNIL